MRDLTGGEGTVTAGAEPEITGNHYLSFPDIRPEDGAVGSVNVLHRGLGGLLSWAGREADPGRPLLRLRLLSKGREVTPRSVRWERLDRWIPRMLALFEDGFELQLTICAPGGFDPLVRGALLQVELRNGSVDRDVVVEFDGCWSATLLSVATTRPLRHPRELIVHDGGVTLESGEPGRGAALTLLASGGTAVGEDGEAHSREAPERTALAAGDDGELRFAVRRRVRLAGGERSSVALYLGVAPERDGALATANRLERVGATDLIRRARLDLAQLARAADDPETRDLLARNLPFHHYFAAGRAIDDDRIYPLMSRSVQHGACTLFGEREALGWSLPAYCLTDPGLARELLMRCLEVHSERPGLHRRYLDGGVVDSGYSLGRACEWGLALLRYVEISRDERILEEPLVQQVIRELDDSLYRRLHRDVFLGSTELLPGGETADFPCSAVDNVLLWAFCRALSRLWQPVPDEPPSRLLGGDEEVESAFWRKCTTDFRGLRVIAGTTDLEKHAAIYDDPACSLVQLPWFGFCASDDPIYVNTMELVRSAAYPLWLGDRKYPGLASRSRPGEVSFAALCAELLSEDRAEAMTRLKQLQLPGDVACSAYDPDIGRAAAGPFAASEAGLLVWTLLHDAVRSETDSR